MRYTQAIDTENVTVFFQLNITVVSVTPKATIKSRRINLGSEGQKFMFCNEVPRNNKLLVMTEA